MDKSTFLKHILADEGLYCIVGIRKRKVIPFFFETVEEAVEKCEALLANENNVYFGCSKFGVAGSREAKNAKYMKAFWLDIDCGPNKPYLTQADGLRALQNFCVAVNLPKPTIVDSGYGIHCYWVLNEVIGYNDWKPVADFLKVLCSQNRLEADKGVTADGARILRVPDTINYKDEEDLRDVKIVSVGGTQSLQDFKDRIGFVENVSISPNAQGTDALTQSLMGGCSSKFATILQKSIKGTGCAQMLHIYTNQNEISEPLWRSGLSIAQFCVDRDASIHKMSNQCESYDPAETEDKASRCVAPHTCATFEELNPTGCIGCALKGTIKSPIVIGKFVEHATPEDNIVTTTHEGLGKETTIIIPDYPYPYFRKKDGGVYMMQKSALADDEEGGDEVMIYEFDLFVEKRLTDPDAGEAVVIKHILKNDGIREFTAPLADILSRDKARIILAHYGVAAMQKKMENIMAYLTKSVQVLQVTTKAEIARSQFGWHDDSTTFLIGTRQITPDGMTFSPPSESTAEVAQHYVAKGHLELWTEVANLYNAPGNEARAFALGISMGSPLVKFSGIRGFILHLTNENSGVGKSTIQHVANSVWGHPVATMLTFDDKPLARQHRFGVLNNIVCCIDEITDLEADEAGHTAFMVTQGKGRDRMQAQTNSIRKNNTTWDLPVITSGNNSLHDLLHTAKDLPEGEIMRIIEVYINQDNSLTKKQSDKYFTEQLCSNYGLAGEIIAEYMVNNKPECLALFSTIREEFDRDAKFTAKERFYSSACAVAITGLEIGKRCGLHSIDVDRVRSWAVSYIGKTIRSFKEEVKSPTSTLGEFINENIHNLLVIDSKSLPGGLSPAPLREPRNELVMRYEPDTKHLHIISSAFNKWCSRRQVPTKHLLNTLEREKVLLDRGAKRMSKGMAVSGPPVYALTFNMQGVDSVFTDVEILPAP